MSIEKTNKTKGDGASLTAPNEDDKAVEKNGETLKNSEEKPEGTDNKSEDAAKNSDKESEEKKNEDKKEDDKQKYGRKRFKRLTPSEKAAKRAREEGIKICVLHEKFPEELLTEEQLKSLQESITDRILEMGEESTTKPKFLSSTHCEGFLSVMCADKPTAEWLQGVTPSLKPWEEASLKAMEDSEMPHPETFVAFLPESQDYSDDKILKLLEAQNDTFSVSSWKVLKKEVVGAEVEVTFSIDRKFTENLKKAGNRVSYKFGHVKLFPKDKKKNADKAGDSKPKPEWRRVQRPRPPKGRKPPPRDFRNSPRGGFKGSRSEWRSNPRSRGPARGSRTLDFRPNNSPQYKPWADGPGGNWGFSGSWNPWRNQFD